MITICCVVGTRPEAIKMAPVILKLMRVPWARTVVLGTGQHREMLTQSLDVFGIRKDRDLSIMQNNQTLAELTARACAALDSAYTEIKPDLVIAQGDTTTVFAAALTAFYRKIPFAHVEAGLRTFDMGNPFPEEYNRASVALLAHHHFAPTRGAAENLLKERIDPQRVEVTGNTVIDALLMVAERHPAWTRSKDKPRILVTMHRRENFGDGVENVCGSITRLLKRFPTLQVTWPVHPNPHVAAVVRKTFGNVPNVDLLEPVDYCRFVGIMKRSDIVLTDSGGVQEEAPALGKPVLVTRWTTERPEAVSAGVAKLVGTDENNIVDQVTRLIVDEKHYASMARHASPYGDGKAADRIVSCIHRHWTNGIATARPEVAAAQIA